MKKIKRIIIVLILVSLASCEFLTGQLTEEDKDDIKSRIEKLEDAINGGGDFYGFLNCFHDDCDYQDTYQESTYNTLASETYNFHDYDFDDNDFEITLEVDEGIVKCKTTIDGVDGFKSKFKMKKDGSKWKIWKWELDGTTQFRNIKTQ